MKKIALFSGSFDPFTIGHHQMVLKSLLIADQVIVAVGANMEKKSLFTDEKKVEMIRYLYRNDPRISVLLYKGLTVHAAQEAGASFIVRGVRSSIDWEYEKTIAEVNRDLSGIETVFLLADAGSAHITSSVVRELLKYQQDISNYIPEELKSFF